jgi:glutathione synthase/RimK-type ligase-like ATP-grasp enzyme
MHSSVNANILVQEFIKEANGKDIRCFVIDGKLLPPFREAMPGNLEPISILVEQPRS